MLRKNSGAGTIYNANAINTTYPGNESNQYMTVIGGGNTQGNTGSTSYGYNASAAGSYGTSIGYNAKSSSGNTVAVGYNASSNGLDSIAVGRSSTASNQGSTSIGAGSSATTWGVAVGANAKALGNNSVAISTNANINASNAIAIGYNSKANTTGSIVIGHNALGGNGCYDVVIGRSANKNSGTSGSSVVIGDCAGYSWGSGDYSVSLGAYSNVRNYSIAIGYQAFANADNTIQLGQGSNGTPYTFQVWGYQLLNNNGYVPIERIAVMSGATVADDGDSGVVPAPSAGDQNKYLRGDGTWQTINTVTSLTALTDTDINNPQDEHALVYSSAKGKWVNKKAGVQATYDATNFRITFA